MAQAARLRAFVDGEVRAVSRRTIEEPGYIGQELTSDLQQGQTLALEKLVSFYTSRDKAISECGLAARKAMAHEFIEALPEGYDTMIGERGYTLSGGQRQRIAIARAVLTDPRILILDEATASVDATTEREIQTALRRVLEDRTTIIIAHRLSTIALADEIVVLDGGTVAARGTHDALYAESAVYREIYDGGMVGAVGEMGA